MLQFYCRLNIYKELMMLSYAQVTAKMVKEGSNSRFSRGSGCYTCRCCGRKTRATGNNDNEHIRLCVECYDIGGIENGISDGHYEGQELIEMEAEIERLKKIIIKKGGTPR